MNTTNVVERAFELAQSGRFASVSEIKAELKRERFASAEVEPHLAGKLIQKQLRDALASCRAEVTPIAPTA